MRPTFFSLLFVFCLILLMLMTTQNDPSASRWTLAPPPQPEYAAPNCSVKPARFIACRRFRPFLHSHRILKISNFRKIGMTNMSARSVVNLENYSEKMFRCGRIFAMIWLVKSWTSIISTTELSVGFHKKQKGGKIYIYSNQLKSSHYKRLLFHCSLALNLKIDTQFLRICCYIYYFLFFFSSFFAFHLTGTKNEAL